MNPDTRAHRPCARTLATWTAQRWAEEMRAAARRTQGLTEIPAMTDIDQLTLQPPIEVM